MLVVSGHRLRFREPAQIPSRRGPLIKCLAAVTAALRVLFAASPAQKRPGAEPPVGLAHSERAFLNILDETNKMTMADIRGTEKLPNPIK